MVKFVNTDKMNIVEMYDAITKGYENIGLLRSLLLSKHRVSGRNVKVTPYEIRCYMDAVDNLEQVLWDFKYEVDKSISDPEAEDEPENLTVDKNE